LNLLYPGGEIGQSYFKCFVFEILLSNRQFLPIWFFGVAKE